MISPSRSPTAALALVFLLIFSLPADAQVPAEPIGRGVFVVDARGSFARYGQSEGLATAEGVSKTALSSRGLGLDVGAHVYVARLGPITFGVGAHWMTSRGSRTPATPKGSQTPPVPPGPTVRTTFNAFSPQLSFNFGTEKGWSYLSGGMGSSRLTVGTVDPATTGVSTVATETVATEEEALGRIRTIDYGGGARWFTSDHLAFTLDLRFYAIYPTIGVGGRLGRPRMTLMVVSGGISFK